jgi:hypothetical protein
MMINFIILTIKIEKNYIKKNLKTTYKTILSNVGFRTVIK